MKNLTSKVVKLRKTVGKEIGMELKRRRKELGFPSYEKFAFKFDIPRASYWRHELGEENMTLDSLMKLLVIHKTTPEEFFETIAQRMRDKKSAKKRVAKTNNEPVTSN